MGCDIHINKEKLVDGQWVTADVWTHHREEYDDGEVEEYWTNDNGGIRRRNYSAFSVLAGVRSSPVSSFKLEPKGIPSNISEETEREYKKWYGDAHSASYLTLAELKELQKIVETQKTPVSGFIESNRYERLKAAVEANEDGCWEHLWPYCEYTQMKNWVPFFIEVPLVMQVGDYIKKIITALEKVGGEDQRIVFWFDN
jgi:hypothetical protein